MLNLPTRFRFRWTVEFILIRLSYVAAGATTQALAGYTVDATKQVGITLPGPGVPAFLFTTQSSSDFIARPEKSCLSEAVRVEERIELGRDR